MLHYNIAHKYQGSKALLALSVASHTDVHSEGFRIVMIRGDFEFNGIAQQVAELPSAPRLDLESRGHWAC